uniref:Pept_C1 domain-containing protein n=1 Tax=Meloidogyne hapla TaxID=6305 RepID=A0A1I8AYK9_MELHA
MKKMKVKVQETKEEDKWSGCIQIISHVQHQGYCGSCWAVSTASCYTDRYCIERAKKSQSTQNVASNIFSSYDLLSCSRKDGCKGGWPSEAWNWIKGNGICTGTDFPLTSVGTQGGENAIKNQLAASGPVTACFDVYEDFKVHKGVYFRVYGKKVGKHAVVILGYGTATCGREKVTYWIIRNSWGTNWGEGGYFKFRRGRNDCGIEGDIAYGVPKL